MWSHSRERQNSKYNLRILVSVSWPPQLRKPKSRGRNSKFLACLHVCMSVCVCAHLWQGCMSSCLPCNNWWWLSPSHLFLAGADTITNFLLSFCCLGASIASGSRVWKMNLPKFSRRGCRYRTRKVVSPQNPNHTPEWGTNRSKNHRKMSARLNDRTRRKCNHVLT